MRKMPFVERMNLHTDSSDPDACWEWGGVKDRDGYGRRGWELAHRTSYETFVGPIPDGLQLDHLCRNRACINPRHLEPVSPRENSLRSESMAARNARKTHCKHGHPFDEQNTYCDSKGRRHCRACTRLKARRYQQRLRERAA